LKENIYTIPVYDGFNEECECPFCAMKNKIEKDTINFILGPSYMEPDFREQTNNLGFCNNHFRLLYLEKNRLGLALISHTHMQKVKKDLTNILEKQTIHSKKGIFKNKKLNTENPLGNYIKSFNDNCYICDKINTSIERYIDTFFYLWKKDENLRNLVKNGKGFCINHFYMLFETSSLKLNDKDLMEFLNILVPIQLENLERIEKDLEWFTCKFDYRFKDEPWKNSKDALPRSIIKLSSENIDK